MFKTSLMPWRGPFGLRRGERGEEHPLDLFHREFDHLFEDFWRGFDLPMATRLEAPFGAAMPRMDVMDEDERYLVSMELPGMDEADVEVLLDDGMLTIKGEKKAETEEKEKAYSYSERTYGAFRRRIPLPKEVLADKIEAAFDKGVLRVTLPKTPEAKTATRKIPIGAKVKKLEKEAA